MADTDLSAWLTTYEAAMRIGCSTRTVERLASAKKLEQRLRPQKGSPDVAVFSPESVAEVATARRREAAPFVVGDVQAGNGHGREAVGMRALRKPDVSYSGEDLIRGLALLLSKALQSPPSPPVAERLAETPWIDIPTAAAILGRSEAYVRRQIKAGRLTAERDRCLVVRRGDVEAL